MSTPFLAEIRLFSFNFVPKNWALCNGQLLAINQNQALFSLLGTTYGGDGRINFALPDLRGRVPVHAGNSISLGERSGEENHIVTVNELPSHSHTVNANSGAATGLDPTASLMAKPLSNIYAASSNLTNTGMAVSNMGGSQPHNNMQPYLVITFGIALTGIFPSRN